MQEITFTNQYGNTVTFARGFPFLLEKISGTGTMESKPPTVSEARFTSKVMSEAA